MNTISIFNTPLVPNVQSLFIAKLDQTIVDFMEKAMAVLAILCGFGDAKEILFAITKRFVAIVLLEKENNVHAIGRQHVLSMDLLSHESFSLSSFLSQNS